MSQRSVLLAMLKENGPKGVSGHELVYRHGITRAAAIVFDLRQEGFDIETVEGKRLPDGRQELASYVLRVPMRTLPPRAIHQEGFFDALPPPSKPVTFDCGCQRSADGLAWTMRCATHVGATKSSGGATPW